MIRIADRKQQKSFPGWIIMCKIPERPLHDEPCWILVNGRPTLLIRAVLLYNRLIRLINAVNAYFCNALWDTYVDVYAFWTDAIIVSLKGVGPLFPWAAILEDHYSSYVRVRDGLQYWSYWRIFGTAALWNIADLNLPNSAMIYSTLLCTAAYT